MKGNEIYNELACVSLSPSMRDIQIAVVLRLAMGIRVLEGKISLECAFRPQTSAVWLKNAVEEAYSIPSELSRLPKEESSYTFRVSFKGVNAKKLLLVTRLLDVKAKRIVPSFPPFIDVSSIPVAKTVWRGAFMARGEANPEKKSGARIYCPFPELASQLEEAAATLGVGVQISSRGKKKSVEVSPANQTAKLLKLIGAGDFAKRAALAWEPRAGEAAPKRAVSQLYEANRQRSSAAAAAACERMRSALKILEGRQIKPELRMAGELRLKYPDATLSELGKLSDPPLSKDAVAGRMRRLYRMSLNVQESERKARAKY